MTTIVTTDIFIDIRKISTRHLDELRVLAVGEYLATATRFAAWLLDWIAAEEHYRLGETDKRTAQHLLFVPPLADFSDDELADACDAIVHLSYQPIEEILAPIVDRLSCMTVGMTTERLREKATP
jgi:hypothetical protein